MRFGQYLQVGFFLIFLYLGTLMMWVFGGSKADSETENRALALLPKWSRHGMWSGEYVRGLENYVSDHVPYREALVDASKAVSLWQGFSGKNDAVIVASQANNSSETGGSFPSQSGSSPISSASIIPTPSASAAASTDRKLAINPSAIPAEAGRVVGKVLIVGNRAMTLFQYLPSTGKKYAETINHFQEKIQNQGTGTIRVSALIAPTSIEFVQSTALSKLSASQKDAINDVYQQLNGGVISVDAFSPLHQHRGEPLYFRTDHHWTATGAYYGYTAYMRALGMIPVPLNEYAKVEVKGFLGSLYSATLSKKLQREPDTLTVYKTKVKHSYVVHYDGPLTMNLLDMSHASKKNKYRIFLSGDRPWGQITTDITNGKRLAVIKDSYGNALIPFLLPHFQEIYVIDPRQFQKPLPSFFAEHKINEVLFINNAGVLSDPDFVELVKRIS